MSGIIDTNASYGNDQSAVADVLNNNGVQGTLTVGTTAVEVRVGTSRLENRKSVTLYNSSNNTIYWGYTSGVTVSNGTPIARNQYVEWSIGDQLPIFVIAATTGNVVRITEAG